jgi:hypothetical protein
VFLFFFTGFPNIFQTNYCFDYFFNILSFRFFRINFRSGLTCAGLTPKLREEQTNNLANIFQIKPGNSFLNKQKTLDYDRKILNLVENYERDKMEKFLHSLLVSQND